jgi:hypothetical protein
MNSIEPKTRSFPIFMFCAQMSPNTLKRLLFQIKTCIGLIWDVMSVVVTIPLHTVEISQSGLFWPPIVFFHALMVEVYTQQTL